MSSPLRYIIRGGDIIAMPADVYRAWIESMSDAQRHAATPCPEDVEGAVIVAHNVLVYGHHLDSVCFETIRQQEEARGWAPPDGNPQPYFAPSERF